MPGSRVEMRIKEVVLITSGDLRQSANQVCWPAQEELERKLTKCFLDEGVMVRRAFPVDPSTGHGFISVGRTQIMGRILFVGMLCATLCASMRGQTTLQNLDDDPITYPNDYNTNYRSWASTINNAVGCGPKGCTSSAGMSHTGYLSVDGSSLEHDLGNANGCLTNCYGDALFFNRLYHDSTANDATKLTLDMYATMDSVGNSASQALEYTIEQDVQTSPGSWTPFVYSWQCDYQLGVWRYWDGALRSGMGDWNTVQGKTWPCVTFQPGGTFAHFYFHFQRPDLTHMYYADFTVNTTYRPIRVTVSAPLPLSNYSDGLSTEIQLDGNYYQSPYSAWTDKWIVSYQ